LAGGRTAETKGRGTSAFGRLTVGRAFFLFVGLEVFFFLEAVDREGFDDFFLTLAGGLDLAGFGESWPPAEKARPKNTAQRMAQNRMAARKRIGVKLGEKAAIVKHNSQFTPERDHMNPVSRPAKTGWVEIDLSALGHNLKIIRRRISPGTGIMAVVKADAYGHGLVRVARELLRLKAAALGVASVEEGLLIRKKVSPSLPVILLLGPREEECGLCLDHRLTPVVCTPAVARELNREARRRKITARVHLKVDTGMGRLGVIWSELSAFLADALRLKHVKICGLTSHFARADEKRHPYNRLQWKRYQAALETCREAGLQLTENHAANSAAAFYDPPTHLHFIRPGIALYGGSPSGDPLFSRTLGLAPVMTFKTRIIQVKRLPPKTGVSYGSTYRTTRPETVAILPIGYANGYPRHLSNRAEVLIRGRRFPVIGRVCMNLTIVKVDPREDWQAGEEVVLLGRQAGDFIEADDLARRAGTISYELFCLLGRLNPRIYKNSRRSFEKMNVEH
jgi:alanine racemase